MTDATLLPSESSSLAAKPPPPDSSDSSNSKLSTHDAESFLVYSQDSVISGGVAEVDNGKQARQKRRRTSPEDQATLEAEYKSNPKPDKTARMNIVNKVSLGEKEVQIWFQNRRQNTRRKSRPLLPHEIVAFGLNGMAAFSSDPASSSFFGGSQDIGYSPSSSQLEIAVSSQAQLPYPQLGYNNSPQQGQSTLLQSLNVVGLPLPFLVSRSNTLGSDSQLSTEETTRSDPATCSQSPNQSQFQPSTLGYLSNRRNASFSSFSTPIEPQASVFWTPTISKVSHPASCPERRLVGDSSMSSSSQVRLSLSLDGKAELISSNVSPTHPKLVPRPTSSGTMLPRLRPSGLQRSHSAIPFGSIYQKNSSTALFAPRLPSGRSRDARTWKFCCDTDARDELTTQAENESSGSALAAISLIRSTSSSTLKPNLNKRNAPPPKQDYTKQGKRPKIARSSSLAKLQGNGKTEVTSPSGDSDKENWVPIDESGNSRRRPLPTSRPSKQARRRILEEEPTASSRSAMQDFPRSQKRSTELTTDIFKDRGVEKAVDPEVEKFMRGEVSPSKKGDLDCIHGLLSLSQGNWR